jgi:non-ribosomal peptide synthase protein (TIGR01720 family)
MTLMADLQTVYRQLSEKQAVQLPPKSTSYRYWAQRLEAYANSEALQADLSHWLTMKPVPPIPVDDPQGINLEGSADTVAMTLSPEESGLFLQQPQRRQLFDVESAKVAEAILLTAFAEAYHAWSGVPSLLIELERHGREPLFDDVDLSRTVGFFNNRFPAHFYFSGTSDIEGKFSVTLNTLKQIPQQGMPYGIARYLCQAPEVKKKLRAQAVGGNSRSSPIAEIKFIYSGQLVNQVFLLTSQYFGAEGLKIGHFGMNIAPQTLRAHRLALSAHFVGPQLHVELRYSKNQYRRATIERLMEAVGEALRGLIS